jgi:hypothetical protein
MHGVEKGAQFKVGDKVRIPFGARLVGTVTEVRVSPTQAGRVLYRVRVPMDPEPLWMEVREDEIEKA